jgi:hypothetical protein
MSSPKLEKYIPEDLEPGQIRVLFILWSKSVENLTCGIYHTVPGALPYTAISYAWNHGSENYEPVEIPLVDVGTMPQDEDTELLTFSTEPRRFITVDNRLRELLLSVGSIGEDSATENDDRLRVSAVWIDQISINQANIIEKSEQVKRMHEIYISAEKTIIYLGEPSGHTKAAFEAARILSFMTSLKEEDIPFREIMSSGWIRPLRKLDWAAVSQMPSYKPKYFEFTKETSKDGYMNPFATFANDVLGRSWFTRTWTVQELVSSRQVTIKTGNYTMDWDTCVQACTFARDTGLAKAYTANGVATEMKFLEDLRQHRRNALEIDDIDNEESVVKFVRSAVFRAFPQVVPMVLYKGVTDPRDKIFAILNITSDIYNDDLRPKITSIINYDLSLRDVYIRACEIWHAGSTGKFNSIMAGDSCRELSFLDWVMSTTGNGEINLPAWVPNWIQHGPPAMFRTPGFCAAVNEDNRTEPKPHIIFPSRHECLLDEVPLTVRGVSLFSIYRVAPMAEDKEADESVSHEKMMSLFSDPYPTTELSYVEAYRLALTPESTNVEAEKMTRTCAFWDFVNSAGETYATAQARQEALTQKEIHHGLPIDVLMSRVAAGSTNSGCLARGRSFFVTATGFIGLAPIDAKDGDEILLLFGGRTPYLARKLSPGRYRFIGACLPFGVLFGEAMKGYPEDKVTDFVLV